MKRNFDGFAFGLYIGLLVVSIVPFLHDTSGSISPVQIAMQQSFWKPKLIWGLMTGLLVGILLGYLYNKKLHQHVFFGIVGISVLVSFISQEGYRQTWGWGFAREMLAFSISWLWAYFAGALLVHLLFKRVKKASQ